ncbi:MAG: MBL fold metallo-hydrolase [Acidobacteria bacterium]|nr:MBL fold metallo-hydrolase [Acidobacteriota bacterium]
MKQIVACLVVAAALAATIACGAAARTLDIYFIDVEGGQSTLIVTPARQTLLIDAGFPGSGTFQSKPGDPRDARDAQRIAAAARDAGVARIDYLLITHFHADHDGGVVELAQLMPIGTFIDHGSVPPEAEQNVAGTLDAFQAYAAVRAKGRHIEPKLGDRLPLKGLDAIVVSSAGSTIVKPLAGAGGHNPACAATSSPGPDAQEPHENPRSTGIRLRFGKFRFLDVGDLSGQPLFALACPNNLVGPVDVYLVAHHANVDATDPATFAAFKARVAILNNGATKGGAPEVFATLHRAPGLEDVWQLHRSENAGADNFTDDRIANLNERTAHWIKLSANDDGSFRVRNGRTGGEKGYGAR